MKTDLTLKGFLFSLLLCLGILVTVVFGVSSIRSCSNPSDQLDSLSNKVKIEREIMHDTIIKYDTIKTKAKIVYVSKRDTLWKYPPDVVDSVFNATFPRDSLDTTNYSTGYTQLRKAIDANNRSERDSILSEASEAQVKTCTTTVTRIVDQVDSTKNAIKTESKITWKTLSIVAVVCAVLGLFGGLAAN